MCGRYSLATEILLFARYFHMDIEVLEYSTRYNISPGQQAPVITADKESAVLSLMRWGLMPEWLKNKQGGKPLINARAETLYQKPAFRSSLELRRCLIPADGFYEWKKGKGGKTPFRIVLPGVPVFAFAGIWDIYTTAQGIRAPSFCIITTASSKTMSDIHARMPVLLTDSRFMKQWLDKETPMASLLELLKPFQGRLTLYPVSTAVNSPLNDGPECITEVPH